MKFAILDQVMYIPRHAAGDKTHRDVECGFVTSQPNNQTVFVRYWRRGEEGKVLRTTSCSEGTPVECLLFHKSATPEEINRVWFEIAKELNSERNSPRNG